LKGHWYLSQYDEDIDQFLSFANQALPRQGHQSWTKTIAFIRLLYHSRKYLAFSCDGLEPVVVVPQ
jgi:hypothetical protein